MNKKAHYVLGYFELFFSFLFPFLLTVLSPLVSVQ